MLKFVFYLLAFLADGFVSAVQLIVANGLMRDPALNLLEAPIRLQSVAPSFMAPVIAVAADNAAN